jgi:hypothetical protein
MSYLRGVFHVHPIARLEIDAIDPHCANVAI